MIDATASGMLNNETVEQAIDSFESMAMNSYQWNPIQAKPNRAAEIYDADVVTALAVQVEAVNKN